MLFEIFSLLLQVITALIAGTCLLRGYIQFCGIQLSLRSANPIAPFVFALTNWIVLPMRRILPAVGRIDTASFTSAYLVALAKYGVFWLLAESAWNPVNLPIQAAIEIARTCISGLFWIVIIYALASWLRSASPAMMFIELLAEPVLEPLRRVLPRVGGLDLSALALIVILQILEIVLHHFSRAVLL